MKLAAVAFLVLPVFAQDGKWVQLFNGKDLTGWQLRDTKDTFSVEDSAIKAHGTRSHCFYVGLYMNHQFNGKQIVNWTQPANWNGTEDFAGRKIGVGTIALQGHDPRSTVYYRNIRIRPL